MTRSISMAAALLLLAACGDSTENTGGTHAGGASAGGHAAGGGNAGGGDAGGGNVGGGANCEATGDTCVDDNECCTNYCETLVGKCAPEPGRCTAAGDACQTGPECCTFSCVGGVCSDTQCVSDGEACTASGECCSGTCDDNGACVALNPGCSTSGNACTQHDDCCSHDCHNGICENPSYCAQTGDVCAAAGECCSGLCDIPDGATLGTCSSVPSTGTPGCSIAGEVCAAGASYTGGPLPICGGECCSRACFPYGPTGALICQPPSGCRPTGEICTQDIDCCGAEGNPDGDTAHITCSKEDGNPVGRCDNGNSCTPAGGICRLMDIECNANANCCSGNSVTMPTCEQDNLGIPRCLAMEHDCTDPQATVGQQCASSADCCGLPCVFDPQSGTFICGAMCVPVDGACTNDADCCTGEPCTIPSGSSQGTCGPPQGCADYGQACTQASDCCNGVPCTDGFCFEVPR